MQLTLSTEEARELRELFAADLSELRSEIHHTDSSNYRERLKNRERLLRRLQEVLQTVES